MDNISLFLLVGIAIIAYIFFKRQEHKKNINNFKNCVKIMTTDEIDTTILAITDNFTIPQGTCNYVYNYVDMPLGRASAFLNYHNTNIYNDEPYVFLCKRSLKDDEFREYGCIVARYGIYISYDNPQNANLRDKQAALPGKDISISFRGITGIRTIGKNILITYVQPNKWFDTTRKFFIENDIERSLILNVLNQIVAMDIGLVMLKEHIVEDIDEISEKLEQVFGSINNAQNYYSEKTEAAEKHLNQNGINKGFSAAAIQAVQQKFSVFYQENKHYMDGSQGHGYAAEYGNNAVDRFLAKNVENAAQQLENGHQVKAGADRIVNGVKIQTKYYKTAAKTIDAVFDNGEPIYKILGADGTEKMMVIEVPRDQYLEALEIMQKRIDDGQVPNVEPGESAKTYVKKGYFTYSQSFMIAKSGTIQSLTVDAISGAVCCSQAAGITALLTFALAIWNGQSVKDAFKQSITTGLKVLGKGTLIYTLTMQLSRKNVNNAFGFLFKGNKSFENPVFIISENLSKNINSSALAKTQVGKYFGLDTVTGRQIIGGAVTVAVVFGPDIARALVGRISKRQLIKNSAIGVAGILGGVLGQTIIPIPIVGSMIGGAITSFVVKKTLDHYIEDDAKEMFRILKEEFLDTVMLAGLTHDEFEDVVKLTIGYKKLSVQLQKMYQSQEFRRYAREAIMEPAIDDILKQREIIVDSVYEENLRLLATET